MEEEVVISIEDFIKIYKPIECTRCSEKTEGIHQYINTVDKLHQIRLEPAYTMHCWTEINYKYLVNGKVYTDATGMIICKEPHDIETKLKVNYEKDID